MNLVEALRTKKDIVTPALKFNRASLLTGCPSECSINPGKVARHYFLAHIMPYLHENDLLRDDWEVEEKEVVVTKKKLLDAYSHAMKDQYIGGKYTPTHSHDTFPLVQFLKYLGID